MMETGLIQDEKTKEIQRRLQAGETRDEIAQSMDYSTYKSMDMYMRRKGFRWDSDRGNYIHEESRIGKDDIVEEIHTGKAATAISLLKKEGADVKAVAKRLGFKDHMELAAYMKGKGYSWDSAENNYSRKYGLKDDQEEATESQPEKAAEETFEEAKEKQDLQIDKYLPFIEMLYNNKDKLLDMLIPSADTGRIPRYAVPGIARTKSVHLADSMARLVNEFSSEKNIAQKDIFVVALVEFFKKYGYEREIESLLKG